MKTLTSDEEVFNLDKLESKDAKKEYNSDPSDILPSTLELLQLSRQASLCRYVTVAKSILSCFKYLKSRFLTRKMQLVQVAKGTQGVNPPNAETMKNIRGWMANIKNPPEKVSSFLDISSR